MTTSQEKKCSWSINSCWPDRWAISSGGLKTATLWCFLLRL
jgi:hypothetical protein